MNYQEAIDWIYSTQQFGIKLGLDAPKKLLAHYLAFPKSTTKVAHVAGTNGKGSTCAILDSLAQASGVRCGLFTSPHLVDFRERIRVSGVMISEEDTARHITAIRDLVCDWEHHPTFFELALAVAMRYFRDQDCELIILETGMGGRLDATTAVPADVCGITPIALDHTQWLGETMAEVASEKAGIIINDSPVFSAKQHPDAERVIATQANSLRAPLTIIDEPLEAYSIGLAGEHQKENAALALEMAHALGFSMRYDNVKAGLANVSWPGRFEIISEDPLEVIDGAHNPHAAKVLLETWQLQFPKIKPVVVFGAIESKDLTGVCEQLAVLTDTLIYTPVNSPRTIAFEDIETLECLQSLELLRMSNITESLSFARSLNRPILITGSLYLLGEYKSLLMSETHRATSQ